MEILNIGNVKMLVSEKLDGVKHGFTLRSGGFSKGEFDSLNVGLRRGDNPFDVFKNIELCADCLKLSKENLTLTNQTHTSNVVFLAKEDIGKGLIREWGKGVDGIVTDFENVPLLCYSADCVPVLLWDKKRKMIGAVHSGWRGTSENIVKNAVELMESNGSSCADIAAFIGPAIERCCYEVSCDVAEHFMMYDGCFDEKQDGKYMLDLKRIVKLQLENAGVSEDNIDVAPYCTACDNDKFFSHRRQGGKSGLLGGFIQMI